MLQRRSTSEPSGRRSALGRRPWSLEIGCTVRSSSFGCWKSWDVLGSSGGTRPSRSRECEAGYRLVMPGAGRVQQARVGSGPRPPGSLRADRAPRARSAPQGERATQPPQPAEANRARLCRCVVSASVAPPSEVLLQVEAAVKVRDLRRIAVERERGPPAQLADPPFGRLTPTR